MHKQFLVLALVALAAARSLFAVHPPDGFMRDEAAFARRGALGADHYVITNVTVAHPSYLLVTSATTNLVDRATQAYRLERATTFVLPPPPAKRDADAWRAARNFLLCLTIPTDNVPEVRFTGARTIRLADGDLSLAKGINLIQFVEIAEDTIYVEKRQLDLLP